MSDLRNLETFAWVARLGSFRLTAERLNTTQPAVSARIAQLERELGVSLFERQRRGALTAKGQELLGYAEQMLQLRSEMVRHVGKPSSMRGLIRIGALETIAHTWLTVLLKRIRADHPGLSIQIEIDTTPKLRRALLSQDLDVACHLGTLTDPRFINAPLGTYPVAWLASPRLDLPPAPLTLAQMIRWPIIISRPHVPHSALIKRLVDEFRPRQAQLFSSTSIASIVQMTRDGIGIGVIPLALVGKELENGDLRLIQTDLELPPLEFTVSYPEKPENALAASLADLAIETARSFPSPACSISTFNPAIQKND